MDIGTIEIELIFSLRQIFSEFFKKITYFIRLNSHARCNGHLETLDTVFHLLECYTILVNNVQVGHIPLRHPLTFD